MPDPDQSRPEALRRQRRVFAGMYAFWGGVAVLLLVLTLAGCGDDGDDEATPTTPAAGSADPSPAEPGTTVIAALGDSITAGSPLWDPRAEIREQIGPALDERSQFEYWASEEDPELEFRNCGVFGERTDEIAARLDECVGGAYGADILIVQGGINDIAQGRAVADAAADLGAMVREGLDRGLEVAITEVLPWNNGFPTAAEPIDQLNTLIAEIAAENEIPLMPFYSTLDNPEQPGTMAPENTDDGDHPSIEGYRLLAERAVLPNLP